MENIVKVLQFSCEKCAVRGVAVFVKRGHSVRKTDKCCIVCPACAEKKTWYVIEQNYAFCSMNLRSDDDFFELKEACEEYEAEGGIDRG